VTIVGRALTLILAISPTLSAVGAEGFRITPTESWSTLFAGEQVVRGFNVAGRGAFKGIVAWGLTVNRAVVSRGERAVGLAPNKATNVKLKLSLPPVKDGVVMPADLAVSLRPRGPGGAVATFTQRLWLFSRKPFAGRSAWLKSLRIRLFDPEGATSKVLTEASIPFALVRNVDAVADLEGGLLIIGEGTSFRNYRGLAAMMVKAAARGVPVLCLAPSGGDFAAAGAGDPELPSPVSIAFRREDIITEFDKRLDAGAWPHDGRIVATTLLVKADRGRVVVRATDRPAGWPWLEAVFGGPSRASGPSGKPGRPCRLVVCGFAIVRKWGAGPTPRHLFGQMLRRLDWTVRKARPGEGGT